MAEHVWSVLCRRVLVDRESNATSLIDLLEIFNIGVVDKMIFDRLTVGPKKDGDDAIFYPTEFRLMSWWVRSDLSKEETAIARISLEAPSGALAVLADDILVNLREGRLGHRINMKLLSLSVIEAGRYWFVVEQRKSLSRGKERWKCVARVPLEVEVQLKEEPPSASI